MPSRAEKDYATTLGGTVAYRDHRAASLEHDKAAKYVGYIPVEFLGQPGIIKDFNQAENASLVMEAPKKGKASASN